MSRELNVDKVNRGLNVSRLLDKAVMRKYSKPEDGGEITVAYTRALEDATRDVKLTVEDFEQAAKEARDAMGKRLAARKARRHQ